MQTKDTVDYYTKRAAVQNYENSFCCLIGVFHEVLMCKFMQKKSQDLF